MTAACGIACEICGLKVKGVCPGCVAGTDPKAPERAETIICAVFKCAIQNKVDYCFECQKFPCDVHYEATVPYTKEFLDFFKKFKEEK